mgnify:FL=1
MRQFISRKTVKVPRYKLYYFILVIAVFLIFFFNLFINFFLKHVSEEEFLNVLVGNSLGGVTNYRFSNLSENYFYQNVFGFKLFQDQDVLKDHDSLEDVVMQDLNEVVYIYNTFQTDQYQSNYFNSYSIASYVTQASFILKEELEKLGVGAMVEKESVVEVLKENNIPYTNSYAGSRILLEQRVKEKSSLKYYFDLQLSDYDREETTMEIEGVSFAKILFVIGTDYGNYQENQKFATELNNLLESINPSLSRGISLRGGTGYHGVYNQDFSPHALLIQVGGVHNTIDEVNRSLEVLAKVLAKYILGG